MSPELLTRLSAAQSMADCQLETFPTRLKAEASLADWAKLLCGLGLEGRYGVCVRKLKTGAYCWYAIIVEPHEH